MFEQTSSRFEFDGHIGTAAVKMRIAEKAGEIKFSIVVKGVALSDTGNPIGIGLQIGNDGGRTRERLQGVLYLGRGRE
jgi:hypothetical protein